MKRGRQSTTTPQALRQGNRAVAKATRYPEGGTSTNTGPGHHKGPTTGGREATRDRGGEPTTAKKRTNAKEPHHTKRGTQGPKERTPAETQAKAQTQQKAPQTGARHEKKRDTTPRTNRRQGKHGPNHEHANKRPNHKKRGGQEGNWTPKRPQKDPHHTVASGGNSLHGAQGQGAQETKMVEKRNTKPRGEKKGGGSLRHTPCSVFKVVLFIWSESVSPAVPDRKGDRIKPFLPCGMEPQFVTFRLKGNPVGFLRFPP